MSIHSLFVSSLQDKTEGTSLLLIPSALSNIGFAK